MRHCCGKNAKKRVTIAFRLLGGVEREALERVVKLLDRRHNRLSAFGGIGTGCCVLPPLKRGSRVTIAFRVVGGVEQ